MLLSLELNIPQLTSFQTENVLRKHDFHLKNDIFVLQPGPRSCFINLNFVYALLEAQLSYD